MNWQKGKKNVKETAAEEKKMRGGVAWECERRARLWPQSETVLQGLRVSGWAAPGNAVGALRALGQKPHLQCCRFHLRRGKEERSSWKQERVLLRFLINPGYS